MASERQVGEAFADGYGAEPAEGAHDWGWLDRAIPALAEAGLSVSANAAMPPTPLGQ